MEWGAGSRVLWTIKSPPPSSLPCFFFFFVNYLFVWNPPDSPMSLPLSALTYLIERRTVRAEGSSSNLCARHLMMIIYPIKPGPPRCQSGAPLDVKEESRSPVLLKGFHQARDHTNQTQNDIRIFVCHSVGSQYPPNTP